jgi:hypothetical protein
MCALLVGLPDVVVLAVEELVVVRVVIEERVEPLCCVTVGRGRR